MKVVINSEYGGFGLSDKAIEYFGELKNLNLIKEKNKILFGHLYYMNGEMTDENLFFDKDIPRDDPDLIRVVEELSSEANGDYAKLKIIEIPDDVKWMIQEYDGIEWVAEVHRTWQ